MRRKITLRLSEPVFEYDLYALLKAFWPRAEITSGVSADTTEETEPASHKEEEPDAAACVRYTMTGDDRCLVQFSFTAKDEAVCADLGIPNAPVTVEEEVASWSDRPAAKNPVKRLVYRALSDMTGRTLPWGDLTGIRPVKLVSGLLREGLSDEAALERMRTMWLIGDRKAALALATAKREKEILERIRPEEGYSLYIGIPFCPSICLYCSFGSHPLELWKDQVDAYLDCLKKELAFLSEHLRKRRLDTIYIGGGTPTTLTGPQMDDLLAFVEERFPTGAVQEYTLEAGRPDTITEEKLRIMRAHGVTRISVNPQTMHDETLRAIGRGHKVGDTKRAFELARDCGFDNINMDLIIGLPGEGEAEVAATLEEIRKLSPDSLTIHSLALKRATRLHLEKDDYEEACFRNSDAIMDRAAEAAASMGMGPYYLYRQKQMAGNFENVGYARCGKEGIYNILIMEQRQSIYGAGAGASTKLVTEDGTKTVRIENVRDLTHYLTRVDEMIERKKT